MNTSAEKRLPSLSVGLPAAITGLALTLAVSAAILPCAQAQTFSVIHHFTGATDGSAPRAGLTMDAAGNLYGTASQGGTANHGAAFRLRPVNSGWIFSPLYSFQGEPDGATPLTRVTFGPDGALYGTTARGGNEGCNITCGTVFKLRPPATVCSSVSCPWGETVLYRFAGGSDGNYPIGEPVFDHAGDLYGTTELGGSNDQGTVYQLVPSGGSWTHNVLYQFAGGSSDGYGPNSGVVLDSNGNLYGTTYYGGAFGPGVAYQVSYSGSNWTESVIHDFQGADDGSNPVAGLIFDSLGNLYGVTPTGASGAGAAFMLSPSGGGWMLTPLYGFTPAGTGPYGSLTMDSDGNLYGTTFALGQSGMGSVFKLTHSGSDWIYTDLYDFTGGNDGANPWGGVTLGANGKLYGTTGAGGSHGLGVVWEIAP